MSSSFLSPAECRARARTLRAEAMRKSTSEARDAVLTAADEYDKLAREIEKSRSNNART
jgi:hypothetical protein